MHPSRALPAFGSDPWPVDFECRVAQVLDQIVDVLFTQSQTEMLVVVADDLAQIGEPTVMVKSRPSGTTTVP